MSMNQTNRSYITYKTIPFKNGIHIVSKTEESMKVVTSQVPHENIILLNTGWFYVAYMRLSCGSFFVPFCSPGRKDFFMTWEPYIAEYP